MKKELQKQVNKKCYDIFYSSLSEFFHAEEKECTRLNRCQAYVHETPNFYILQSYNTFVACIEKTSDILVDVSRTEYGYTATTSLHISKFSRAYGAGKYGCETRITAYPVD